MKNTFLFGRLLKASRSFTWLLAASISLLMVIISLFIEVAVYKYKSDTGPGQFSERGYFNAINWSVAFTFFVPMFIYYALGALQKANRVGERLYRQGMLVNTRFNSPESLSRKVTEKWTAQLVQYEKWAIFFSICGLFYCVYEWWIYSGGPLLNGLQVAEQEIDWSVKAKELPEIGSKTNAAFSFCVFMLQAGTISAVSYFVVLIIALSNLFATDQDTSFHIVPNLRSVDKRLGFEVLENIAVNILWASAFGYAAFYLSRLWNAYLHADLPAKNLYDFVIGSIITGFTGQGSFDATMKAAGGVIFEVGHFSASGVMVIAVALVIFALSVLIVIVALRNLAKHGRDLVLEHLDSKNDDYTFNGVSKGRCLERLRTMDVWPIGFPRPSELLLMAAFALLSLIFFRLGLIYIGLLIFIIVRGVFQRTIHIDAKATGFGSTSKSPG